MTSEKKRNLSNYVACTMGNFAFQIGAVYVMTFLSFICTEYFGLPIAIISLILSLGVFVDYIADLVMGVMIDRVKTKHGKAKHWFLWMAVPVALVQTLILFVPTGLSNPLKLVFIAAMYFLMCLGVAAIRGPANTLPTVITNDEGVRITAGFWTSMAQIVGSMCVSIISVPVVAKLGEGVTGYQRFAIIVAFVTVGLCLGTFFFAKEQQTMVLRKEKAQKEEKLTVGQQIKCLVGNKYWLLHMGILIPFYIAAGVGTGCKVYICEYIVGDLGFLSTWGTVSLIFTIIGSLFWAPMAKKFDPRNLFIINGFTGVIGYGINFMALIVWQNPMLVLLGSGVASFGDGVCCDLIPVLVGRVVDYGEYKTGQRQEGLMSSGKTVLTKVVSAVCTAVLGVILTKTGYVAGYFPDAAKLATCLIMCLVPCISYISMIVCSIAFNLTNSRMAEIQHELAVRHGLD